MLATIIRDVFKATEVEEMAQALDDNVPPDSSYAWASAGVYSFWDPSSGNILYIGLAVDLAQRFRQHVGLIPCPLDGCKFGEITEWFQEHEQLGYSIYVQSAASQPVSARMARHHGVQKEVLLAEFGELLQQGRDAIVLAEGVLIESHRLAFGAIPPWNKMGGSRKGGARGQDEPRIFELLSGRRDDWSVSRTPLRQLMTEPFAQRWELYLHAVRIRATASRNDDFDAVFNKFPDIDGVKHDMQQHGYFVARGQQA